MNAAANARLALLALCVALFAVVWSGDQKHHRDAASESAVAGRANSVDSPVFVVGAPVSIHSDDVPLPAALEPGVYRIVGTGGAVRTARFTVDDLLYLGVAVGSDSGDVPTSDDGRQRWYFIRLVDEGRDLSTETALLSDAPLCRATKLLLAWASERGAIDLQFLADRYDEYTAASVRQCQQLARSAADGFGIRTSFAPELAAACRADAPFCRATKLLVAWAGESGAQDVRNLAGRCDDHLAAALRDWQELARGTANDLKQALGRIYRPAKISRGARDDQRL